ncbi:MAG: hypothetical protein E4H01_13990 [Lysobacterales bacterium]|nr:MAG: hypothetical protein E4H01_13990 [Xanthomonadales bacterium]
MGLRNAPSGQRVPLRRSTTVKHNVYSSAFKNKKDGSREAFGMEMIGNSGFWPGGFPYRTDTSVSINGMSELAPDKSGNLGYCFTLKIGSNATTPPKKELRLTMVESSKKFDVGAFAVTKLKFLIVGVDGLHPESIQDAFKSGKARAFTEVFKGAVNENGTVLSALPTITWCNWPGILSGQAPRDHGIIGNSFFEREKDGTMNPCDSACDTSMGPFGNLSEDHEDSIAIVCDGSLLAGRPGLTGRSNRKITGSRIDAGSIYDDIASVHGKIDVSSINAFYCRAGGNVRAPARDTCSGWPRRRGLKGWFRVPPDGPEPCQYAFCLS